MKCQERELLIEEFVRSLPAVEHEWQNIANNDEYSHYICRHCTWIEKRMNTLPGDGK